MRAGTSDVYRHEMPGGQYTNLREQALGLVLDARWREIARSYADVNQMFGDIIKVTPTSKVVGDLALFMVANDLDAPAVLDPTREIPFPESVVSLFKGELGFPADGFPAALQHKVLAGQKQLSGRPGASLAPIDLRERQMAVEKTVGRALSATDLASSTMYPEVFNGYATHRSHYSDVGLLPTPAFFYGIPESEEITAELGFGKALLITLHGQADAADDGEVKLLFELNGQSRLGRVAKHGAQAVSTNPLSESGNPDHVGAPMPGMIAAAAVTAGQKVKKGDPLLSIEAMKMETQIRAEADATVLQVLARRGATVEARELLIVTERMSP